MTFYSDYDSDLELNRQDLQPGNPAFNNLALPDRCKRQYCARYCAQTTKHYRQQPGNTGERRPLILRLRL